MNLWDYRLIAEYYLLRDKRVKLEDAIDKIGNDKAPDCFEPKTPLDVLARQWSVMFEYENILEYRLDLECPGWRV